MAASSPNIIGVQEDVINGLTSEGTHWRLAYLLQSTLEVNKLFQIFCEGIKPTFPFDSLHFKYDKFNIKFESGNMQTHTVRYQLSLDEENIGEIVLSRQYPFLDTEIDLLETHISMLVYPLRNCYHYYSALKAALYDPLTGLSNRIGLVPSLSSEIDLSKRHQQPLTLLMLDIDNFKEVNDMYGHPSGDALLVQLSQHIKQLVRKSDLLFRFGGDEFILILRKTDHDGAKVLAERIRVGIQDFSCQYKQYTLRTTVSVGIACLQEQDTCDSLLERVDQALLSAKQTGKNTIVS